MFLVDSRSRSCNKVKVKVIFDWFQVVILEYKRTNTNEAHVYIQKFRFKVKI